MKNTSSKANHASAELNQTLPCSVDYSITANDSLCCGRLENHSCTIFTSLLALSNSHSLLTGVDLVRPLPKSALRLVLPCGPRQGIRPGPVSKTASSPCLKWFSILVHWVEWCGTVPCLALVSSFLLTTKGKARGGFDLLPPSGDVFPVIARVLTAVTQNARERLSAGEATEPYPCPGNRARRDQ